MPGKNSGKPNSRSSQKKNLEEGIEQQKEIPWTWTQLFFIAIGVLLAVVGATLLSSFALISRRTRNVDPISPTDAIDLDPIYYQEPDFAQSSTYKAVFSQLGRSIPTHIKQHYYVTDQCIDFTEEETDVYLNNRAIAITKNSNMEMSEAEKNKTQNVQKSFNVKNASQWARIPKEEFMRFKKTLKHKLINSSLIAKRLMRVFLQSDTARLAQYDAWQDITNVRSNEGLSGQYVVRNNTVRIFRQLGNARNSIPHEMGHGAATLITDAHLEQWPPFSISENGGVIINEKLYTAFPCELKNETFYNYWLSEIKENILKYKKNMLSDKSVMKQDPVYRKFLKNAQNFEPVLTLMLPTEQLKQLEKNGYGLGKIVNFSRLSINMKIKFIVVDAYRPLPNNELQNLLVTTDLRIEDMYESVIDGLSFLAITPLTLDNEIRASYLINAAESHLNHVNSHTEQMYNLNENFPACQEAYGVFLEWSEKVLRVFFPNTTAYLHERLDKYEEKIAEESKADNFKYDFHH